MIDTSLTLEQIRNLSSQDRMTIIFQLKAKVLQGDKISEDELRLSARLLKAERGARSLEAGKRSSTKAPKEPAATFDLSKLIRGEDPISTNASSNSKEP